MLQVLVTALLLFGGCSTASTKNGADAKKDVKKPLPSIHDAKSAKKYLMTALSSEGRQQDPRCPPEYYTGMSGHFFSQNYPQQYEHNLRCVYRITVPAPMATSLFFTTFQLEASFDKLYVFEGAGPINLLIELTGEFTEPLVVDSAKHELLLLFVTDAFLSFNGFAGTFVAMTPPVGPGPTQPTTSQRPPTPPVTTTTRPVTTSTAPASCPEEEYPGPSGELFSPGYPNNYPDSANCIYRITVQEEMAVQLTFGSFHTEAGFDFLHIFNGAPSSPDNLIESLNGEISESFTIVSSSNQVFMNFVSDNSITFAGFAATYDTVPMPTTPTIAPPTPISPICGEHYAFDGASGRCYRFVFDFQTFDNASEFCQNEGGHLVSLHLRHVENFLLDLMAVYIPNTTDRFFVWTGGRRGDDFNFHWTDGSRFDYAHFLPGFPAPPPYDCIQMSSFEPHGWITDECSVDRPFICAKIPALPHLWPNRI